MMVLCDGTQHHLNTVDWIYILKRIKWKSHEKKHELSTLIFVMHIANDYDDNNNNNNT